MCFEESIRIGGVYTKSYDRTMLTTSSVLTAFSDYSQVPPSNHLHHPSHHPHPNRPNHPTSPTTSIAPTSPTPPSFF